HSPGERRTGPRLDKHDAKRESNHHGSHRSHRKRKSRRRGKAATHRRSSGQPRYPRHGGSARRARLSEAIPVRPSGDRRSGVTMETGPERYHSAHSPGAQGARLSKDLEHREKRISAQDHHALAIGEARSGDFGP